MNESKKRKINVVFFGTPIFSCAVLKALLELKEINILGVVSQPDRPIGRKRIITASPVKTIALENNILVWQPEKVGELLDDFKLLNIEAFITCAYGQIIPSKLLALPLINSINVHASLLPKLRGGAPIHRAIINNYSHTGITLMKMIPKMDAGEMYYQKSVKIDPEETAKSLYKKLETTAYEVVKSQLLNVLYSKLPGKPQIEEEVTYGFNITRDDEKINWSMSVKEIDCLIRGLYDWPISYTTLNNVVYKIHKANVFSAKLSIEETQINDGVIININKTGIFVKCGNGILQVIELQKSGSKLSMANSYVNSNSIKIGDQFI